MKFADLYKSVFAILRIEGNQAKVVGTGFVIQKNPLRIITCNHVAGEGNENNSGSIRYAITKRSDNFEEFDLRQGEITFLQVKQIHLKPEYDLAVLEVDPAMNTEAANRLDINSSPYLALDFSRRELGSQVQWLSTAATGDLTLTPRFFKGNLISTYITNQGYKFRNNQGVDVNQVMTGVTLLEVDKLFIPGCSGSPILDSSNDAVIGYVHGFRSWPIPTNNKLKHKVKITENADTKETDLEYSAQLITSLSLGIDVKTAEAYLREQRFLP